MAVALEKRIQEVLNQEDIEGLLALGAPRDEYEGEAEHIGLAIRKLVCDRPGAGAPIDAVKGIINATWRERFGPFSEEDLTRREPALERVATRIAALSLGLGTACE